MLPNYDSMVFLYDYCKALNYKSLPMFLIRIKETKGNVVPITFEFENFVSLSHKLSISVKFRCSKHFTE